MRRWRLYEGQWWGLTGKKIAGDSPGLIDNLLAAVKELDPVSAGKLEDEFCGSPGDYE